MKEFNCVGAGDGGGRIGPHADGARAIKRAWWHAGGATELHIHLDCNVRLRLQATESCPSSLNLVVVGQHGLFTTFPAVKESMPVTHASPALKEPSAASLG